jgi:uncharacterized membrane protein YdbT with pleckstrin-like domain
VSITSQNLLGQITSGSNDFAKLAILASWLQQACVNAGISLVATSPQQVLDVVRPGDTDLQKWQKVASWAQQLANGLAGGVGQTVVSVSAGSTLGANTYTVVTASGNTNQALPTAPTKGTICIVKNQGTGLVTVTATSAIIFTGSLVSSFLIGGTGQTGNVATCTFDGTYWNVS